MRFEYFAIAFLTISYLFIIPTGASTLSVTQSSQVLTAGGTIGGALVVTNPAGTAGSAALTVNQGAHTAITVDRPAESITAASPILASGTTIAIGSWLKLAAPTYIGVAGGAAETVTSAATLYIDAAPTQGANLTLSNPYAFWVDAGATRLDGTLTSSAGGALTGTWTDLGTVTTVDINGGTIDGVTIGGASAGAVTSTSLNLSEGNMTNGGSIAVDSIDADATTVNYNDVNIFEIAQEDLTAGSCTLGQLRIDTGGVLKEWCYCAATNTWYCITMTTITGPSD